MHSLRFIRLSTVGFVGLVAIVLSASCGGNSGDSGFGDGGGGSGSGGGGSGSGGGSGAGSGSGSGTLVGGDSGSDEGGSSGDPTTCAGAAQLALVHRVRLLADGDREQRVVDLRLRGRRRQRRRRRSPTSR